MSLWKRVGEYYERAHEAAQHGDYSRAVRNLDRCIDILSDAYKSPVHYKLAIFYCKLGRALLRISQNPVPDTDSEEIPDEERDEGSSSYESDSGSQFTDGETDSEDSSVRKPFDIIIEKFKLALECINATPASKRNSIHTLLIEAEIYQSMGETAMNYGRQEIEEWLTFAMGLYLRLYSPVCAEIGACRFFLGKHYFRTKNYRRAAEELQASLDILNKLEVAYREQIRSLIKLEHEVHFHFSAKTKLRKLQTKKHSLRKKLKLTKSQIREISGLVALSQNLGGVSASGTLTSSALGAGSGNEYRGGLLCMRSLGISAENKLTSSHVTIDEATINWALNSLPPNFKRLAASETKPERI